MKHFLSYGKLNKINSKVQKHTHISRTKTKTKTEAKDLKTEIQTAELVFVP